MSLSSAETKTPIPYPVGDFMLMQALDLRLVINGRLTTKIPKHHAVTSPPINQKEVRNPTTLTINVTFKNPSLKVTGEFGSFDTSHPLSLLDFAIKAILSYTTNWCQ